MPTPARDEMNKNKNPEEPEAAQELALVTSGPCGAGEARHPFVDASLLLAGSEPEIKSDGRKYRSTLILLYSCPTSAGNLLVRNLYILKIYHNIHIIK